MTKVSQKGFPMNIDVNLIRIAFMLALVAASMYLNPLQSSPFWSEPEAGSVFWLCSATTCWVASMLSLVLLRPLTHYVAGPLVPSARAEYCPAQA